MRMLLYICILGLLFFAPVQRLDVAILQPVQTVAVSICDQQMVIETDTGNLGLGSTVEAAIKDLETNTPGVIYLDTAQYLLLTEEAMTCWEELKAYMRPGVRISLWDGISSPENAAQYLAKERDLPKRNDFRPPAEKKYKNN